jgi:HEXXH motif-containing protein
LPLVCGDDAIGSGSREELLGLVYLPASDSLSNLAECLLHEAMHQFLFRLEECRSLFLDGTPSDDRFYSPWRSDARPIRMVLHGAFVFTAIADLYLWQGAPERLSVEAHDCQQRAYQCSRQAQIALDIVQRHSRVTPIGQLILDTLAADLSRIKRDAKPRSSQRIEVDSQILLHEERHAGFAR